VFLTTILACFILLLATLRDYATSQLATFSSISNLYFLYFLKDGYFSNSATIVPLLHTWSLGVEEQFYIFGPLLLACFSRFFSRIQLIIISVVLLVGSICLFYMLKRHQVFVYYFPLTRAFELLFGATLAIKGKKNFIPSKIHILNYEILALLGLILILFPSLKMNITSESYLDVIFPCLGTTLLIYTGENTTS
jgi:peptidoglycan/LPS O-acetylase OafA/YrhL